MGVFPQSLADEVVRLRAWRGEDVPSKLMLFADPSVTRFSWPEQRPYTEADAWQFFKHQQIAQELGEELNFAFVAPDDTGTVFGGGSIYDINAGTETAAVGYWLTPFARGRGVATHATRLMARWAFDDMRLARIELTCAPDNTASQRVAMRCGFTREGLLRSHMPFQGRRRDTVIFGLLPGELR